MPFLQLLIGDPKAEARDVGRYDELAHSRSVDTSWSSMSRDLASFGYETVSCASQNIGIF